MGTRRSWEVRTIPKLRTFEANNPTQRMILSPSAMTLSLVSQSPPRFDLDIEVIAVARDQEVDIPSQLGLGVRLLQAQSHVFVYVFRSLDSSLTVPSLL